MPRIDERVAAIESGHKSHDSRLARIETGVAGDAKEIRESLARHDEQDREQFDNLKEDNKVIRSELGELKVMIAEKLADQTDIEALRLNVASMADAMASVKLTMAGAKPWFTILGEVAKYVLGIISGLILAGILYYFGIKD